MIEVAVVKNIIYLGTALVAIIAVIFNIWDRYKKIPQHERRLIALEEKETCIHHEGCFKNLSEDIDRLDKKICKNIVEVKTKLNAMEDKRQKSKDALSEELKIIHHALGRIEGKLNNVPK